jgi:hypothetical protein
VKVRDFVKWAGESRGRKRLSDESESNGVRKKGSAA